MDEMAKTYIHSALGPCFFRSSGCLVLLLQEEAATTLCPGSALSSTSPIQARSVLRYPLKASLGIQTRRSSAQSPLASPETYDE
jgi:hypothetical protein